MGEPNYWTTLSRKRLTRRRLLAGAAVTGGGLAVASLAGCGSEDSGPPGDDDGGNPLDDVEGITPIDARRPAEPATTDSHGGFFTYIGFDAVVLDRYDPHQTQFGPMYSNQSAVFSKLYRYSSHEEPTWENILPDLAESAPEMIGDPNAPTEYVIKLRKGVKFHDTGQIRGNFPDLAGRELTADDVIFSYERQMSDESPQRTYYYRSSQYKTIEKMEKIDDYTIRFTTKGPVAPFYHFMADTNAMIIPKEIVDLEPGPDGRPWDSVDSFGNRGVATPERMIGTGPFMWENLIFGIEYTAVRNPEWFGWDEPDLGRPYLDGYRATGQGLNDATVESLFRRKEIDVGIAVDNPSWILDILDESPELQLLILQVSGWLGTRFKSYCAPFDDWRVRRALHLAVDRQEGIDVIGSGTYKMVGPVGPAIKYWALPQDELEGLPGYRRGAGRDADIMEARQLYEAADKPELPLIWFADVPAYIPRFAPTYIETIKRNLGIDQDIKFQSVPYSRIAEGLVNTECDQAAMTWGFDNGWIDLDDWVFPYFRTDAPKNSFRVSDPALDVLLDSQRTEFDADRRKALGYEIQRYLLGMPDPETPAAHMRLDYLAPYAPVIFWPYVKNPTLFPWFGNQYWVANSWIDKNDASHDGRAS